MAGTSWLRIFVAKSGKPGRLEAGAFPGIRRVGPVDAGCSPEILEPRLLMKTRLNIPKVLALIACLLSLAKASAGELAFATMEDGDKVEITYTSKGCFHDERSYYEVSRTGGVSTFTQYAITWDKAIPPRMLGKKVTGELKLTQADIAGLDALLRFYRGKKDACSTTQDTLVVEYYEGSKRVGSEKLQDESGAYGLEKRKDVVQLFQLAARFQK